MSQGKRLRFPYGGTRNGTVISWPARIRDRGGLRSQWHHVVDVAPTVLGGEVAKADQEAIEAAEKLARLRKGERD